MNLLEITSHCTQVIDKGRYVQATRPDGLEVFFDTASDPLSTWLNAVRADGERKTVFLTVGLARGLQIALNYAEKYGEAAEREAIQLQIESLLSGRLLAKP